MEITLNTTFHVSNPVEARFLDWVRGVFMASMADAGGRGLSLARVLADVEPGASTYAVAVTVDGDVAAAESFQSRVAVPMLDLARAMWGDSVLFFTTFLQPL